MQESFTFEYEPRPEAEEWRPVVGYEGLYEISSLGRVRSLDRIATVNGRYGVTKVRHSGRVLKTWPCGNAGYLAVKLARDGEHVNGPIHVLVAAAFIGPCPEGQEVCHGPNGKLDNRASQIRYGTRTENHRDKIRDGTHLHGERQWMAKLTSADVAEIRRRAAAGLTQTHEAMAAEFGVSRSSISFVISRRTWRSG